METSNSEQLQDLQNVGIRMSPYVSTVESNVALQWLHGRPLLRDDGVAATGDDSPAVPMVLAKVWTFCTIRNAPSQWSKNYNYMNESIYLLM